MRVCRALQQSISFAAGIALLIMSSAGSAAFAQTLSMGIIPEPDILVSSPRVSSHKNLETSLVDIKAVDGETINTRDGQFIMGRAERDGQGIIIDPSGIIVTNKHIIDNAKHIYVTLAGGKVYEATVLKDGKTDFTFVKIETGMPLRALSIGDISQVKIGNPVYALTNARLNEERRRSGQIIEIYRDAHSESIEILQVNIPLKAGDSGGPILDTHGALLGLIMANQKSDTNKSYAIAANSIQKEFFAYKNSVLN